MYYLRYQINIVHVFWTHFVLVSSNLPAYVRQYCWPIVINNLPEIFFVCAIEFRPILNQTSSNDDFVGQREFNIVSNEYYVLHKHFCTIFFFTRFPSCFCAASYAIIFTYRKFVFGWWKWPPSDISRKDKTGYIFRPHEQMRLISPIYFFRNCISKIMLKTIEYLF